MTSPTRVLQAVETVHVDDTVTKDVTVDVDETVVVLVIVHSELNRK